MPLPSLHLVRSFLASSDKRLRDQVLQIARRLEALNEYGPEQALLVAFDIVQTRNQETAVQPTLNQGTAIPSHSRSFTNESESGRELLALSTFHHLNVSEALDMKNAVL